jgi:hypothetical protein
VFAAGLTVRIAHSTGESVLLQIDSLIALGVTAPQDVNAISDCLCLAGVRMGRGSVSTLLPAGRSVCIHISVRGGSEGARGAAAGRMDSHLADSMMPCARFERRGAVYAVFGGQQKFGSTGANHTEPRDTHGHWLGESDSTLGSGLGLRQMRRLGQACHCGCTES